MDCKQSSLILAAVLLLVVLFRTKSESFQYSNAPILTLGSAPMGAPASQNFEILHTRDYGTSKTGFQKDFKDVYNRNLRLILQPDGNLVLIKSKNNGTSSVFLNSPTPWDYSPQQVIWSSRSARGWGPRRLVMQVDGNLVIYNDNYLDKNPQWGTGPISVARSNLGWNYFNLNVRDDGRGAYLVIEDNTKKPYKLL